MKKKTVMGFGGLGDCFICCLKCLESSGNYTYTHVDNNNNRLNMSIELMNKLGINQGKHLVVRDIKGWWEQNYQNYDVLLNVFAKGYIDIPIRPYHGAPCKDMGYHKPFNNNAPRLTKVAVQVGAGGGKNGIRHYSETPLIWYVENRFDLDNVRWFGVDENFEAPGGENYCGKTTLSEAMDLISECTGFVGFNGLFFYWALYNKLVCDLFMDHQGYHDLRIHEEWRPLITNYIGEDKW